MLENRTWNGAWASKAIEMATMTYAKLCRDSPVSIRGRRPNLSMIQKQHAEDIMYEVALHPVRILAKSSSRPRFLVRMIIK